VNPDDRLDSSYPGGVIIVCQMAAGFAAMETSLFPDRPLKLCLTLSTLSNFKHSPVPALQIIDSTGSPF